MSLSPTPSLTSATASIPRDQRQKRAFSVQGCSA